MRRLIASLLRTDPMKPQALVAARMKSVPTYVAVRPSIEAELRRARRYERAMVVAVATPDHPGFALASSETSGNDGAGRSENGTRVTGEADRRSAFEAHVGLLLLADLLQGSVRETDIVAYAPARRRFVVCLPECDGDNAPLAMERVGRMFRERTGYGIRTGVAAYPPDALTLDDLIAQAESALATPSPAPSLAILRRA